MPTKHRFLMRARPGFTLAELMISVMISGMLLVSLAAIQTTSSNYMLQNYRQNVIKNGASYAMKTVLSRIPAATRIDLPAYNSDGNELKIAENVDQMTGCHPIHSAVPRRWHYFCHYATADASCPSGGCLRYYTGTISTAGGACPAAPTWTFTSPYPAGCSGGTYIQLAEYVNVSLAPLFSRRSADDINEKGAVRVRLRVRWIPPAVSGKDLSASSREVDTTLDSTASVQRSACPGAAAPCAY